MLNIIINEAKTLSFANEELLRKTFNKWTKVHRTTEALDFLRACILKKVSPCFVRIPPKEIRTLGINRHEQHVIENRNLEYERNEKGRTLPILQNEFDNLSNEILFLL